MKHDLKIYSKYFKSILAGKKNFELRREDDRKFNVWDWLHLREYSPFDRSYTGRSITVQVTHIQRIRIGALDTYAIMSIRCQTAQ